MAKLKKTPILFLISEIISTFFYVGRAPVAPGTFGSLATFPFLYFICIFLPISTEFITAPWSINAYFLLPWGLSLVLLLLVIGLCAVDYYQSYTGKHDAKEVVIDEVIGQTLALVLILPLGEKMHSIGKIPAFIESCIVIFVLFRIFDITKPLLVGYADKYIKGAAGVILDDVFAGILAAVVFYLLYFFLGFVV